MKPFLRWAGGKGWLSAALAEEISLAIRASKARTTVYMEPFLGGGAVALALRPLVDDTRFELSDANTAVMAVWDAAVNYPEVLAEQVGRLLAKSNNTKDGYHALRDEFNSIDKKSGITYAALALALNRISFNGLWRENKSGKMNVPFGDVKNPSGASVEELIEVSKALCDDDLLTCDFRERIKECWNFGSAQALTYLPPPYASDYFLYVDPPYHDGYVSYVADGFTEDDQRDLAILLKQAAENGAKIWANNSDTPFIRDIYSWADVRALEEPRAIAAKASSRKNAACLMIRNKR